MLTGTQSRAAASRSARGLFWGRHDIRAATQGGAGILTPSGSHLGLEELRQRWVAQQEPCHWRVQVLQQHHGTLRREPGHHFHPRLCNRRTAPSSDRAKERWRRRAQNGGRPAPRRTENGRLPAPHAKWRPPRTAHKMAAQQPAGHPPHTGLALTAADAVRPHSGAGGGAELSEVGGGGGGRRGAPPG